MTAQNPPMAAYTAWLALSGERNSIRNIAAFLAGWTARGPSAAEAGAKGGAANLAKHGRAQMAAIGKMGGDTIKATRGPEFYARIGALGGKANLAKHGRDHLSAIGKRGGQSVVDHLGHEHLRAAGKRGGVARWANTKEEDKR